MKQEVGKGIRHDQYGYRVYVKVRRLQREKRFPFGTKPQTMQNWREEAKVALRKLRPTAPLGGTLQADADRYLLLVRAMPTYAQREEHIEWWVEQLGPTTPRAEVTPERIRAVLQRLRQKHAAATCNKRRTALMHLWAALDGKGASNPVRDVPKFRPADPLPRGKDPHVIDAALLKAPRCRSRACCRVLLWTGMRPCELQRAERDDLDLPHKAVVVRTGKGGRARVVSLTKQAVSAWREFVEATTWQDVPQAAPLNRWLKDHTGIATLRVYDLRHSYGTALARRKTRLDVIGALMGHSTLELTRRYTLAAVTPDALEATAQLETKAPAAGSAAGSRKKSSKSA